MEWTPTERLCRYGFVVDKFLNDTDYPRKLKEDPSKFDWQKWDKKSAAKHAFEELDEEVIHTFAGDKVNDLIRTGYPKPVNRFRITLEAFGMSMEETYFWVLGHLRQDQAYPEVIKVTDIFSSSENSAFWGQSSQRLGLQQDKVSNYLASIGKMVKDLFAIVRELRIIDERLDIYAGAVGKDRRKKDPTKKGQPGYKGEDFPNPNAKRAYDVTLKGLYVDLVEGGSEKPTSVYGMSKQVGFTILPDLFFNTYCYDDKKVDEVVSAMQYNITVKNVLKRKLTQYIIWKNRTEAELESRRSFNVKYLHQHWGVIKMYLGWIKPYVKNIKRLSMSSKQMESPDIVTAFDTSVIEIEFLAKKGLIDGYHPCVLCSFKYTTKPTMTYQQEYQRGPVHIGRVDFSMRSYAWKPEDVKNYLAMRDDEDMELLGIADASVNAAMEELGDPLKEYLEEAGEQFKKPWTGPDKKENDAKKKMLEGFDPFIAVFKGFGEMFGSIIPVGLPKKKSKEKKPDPSKAAGAAKGTMWQTYKNYKKSHKLLSW